MIRTYSELRSLATLEERFDYLALSGLVGEETFGHERWLNQQFYQSAEWRQARSYVLARDYGYDLGVHDAIVRGKVFVHHMNPLDINDIREGTENLLDPEFLITASFRTHNAIHYGDRTQLPRGPIERSVGDTRLW